VKIGKYQITSGPNLQWYLVTAFFIWWSCDKQTPWPILGWLAFCVVLIPLCLWIHKLNEREDAQMLKDFPDDPYIQAKYGKKKTRT
jgi:hypothetical protein